MNNCRWLDRNFGDVCRNLKTHKSMFSDSNGRIVFCEPHCRRCEGCGYEPISKTAPAWDDAGVEEHPF